MVLANAVRGTAAVLVGAAIAGFAAYWVLEAFGYWYGPRYIKSEEDIGNIYMVFLSLLMLAILGGAVLGFRVYRKWSAMRAA